MGSFGKFIQLIEGYDDFCTFLCMYRNFVLSGFTTYVNGAHQEAAEKTPGKTRKSAKSKVLKSEKVPKIIYTYDSVLCWFEGKTQDWKIIWLNSDVEKRRSKTAPTNGRRKNWVASSHDIKTDRGTNIRAKAPGTCK